MISSGWYLSRHKGRNIFHIWKIGMELYWTVRKASVSSSKISVFLCCFVLSFSKGKPSSVNLSSFSSFFSFLRGFPGRCRWDFLLLLFWGLVRSSTKGRKGSDMTQGVTNPSNEKHRSSDMGNESG